MAKNWKDIVHKKGPSRLKDYTEITVLLDRSGSMRSVQESMETALMDFVRSHQETPSTKFNLIQFDDSDDREVVFMGVPISNVKQIRLDPRGNTPLNDAICKSIDLLGNRYSAMPESERPARVLFVIITDGQENCSKQFRRSDVAYRTRVQQDAFKWQFIYLGANQDTYKESQSYGIGWANTLKWSPNEQNIGGTFRSLNASTKSYIVGASASAAPFSSLQREESATDADLAKDSNPDLATRLKRYKITKSLTTT